MVISNMVRMHKDEPAEVNSRQPQQDLGRAGHIMTLHETDMCAEGIVR
jgi:hypothetical protein